MAHRNARLTFHGRRLLVQRVVDEGQAVAHVAKAMGVSRQCAHRWVPASDAEGDAALHDRSSRPHSMPTRTSAEVEAAVVAARLEHRRGQDWLGPELGVPARTSAGSCAATTCRACAELRPADRRGDPGLEDHRRPLRTGPARRAGPHGRQEDRPDPRRRRLARPRPPDGLHRRHASGPGSASTTSTPSSMTTAASPTPRSSPTRRAAPAPGSSTRAVDYFAAHGITRIERVMTDNHWSYTRTNAVAAVLDQLGATPQADQAALPLAERQGRALQPDPANRVGLPAGLHHATTNAPPPLHPGSTTTTTRRRHSALGGLPPISRLSPT